MIPIPIGFFGGGDNDMWRHIQSGNLSSASTLDINVPPNCDILEIQLRNWRPATDGAVLWMRFSQSAVFLSGASDYSWTYIHSTSAVEDLADAQLALKGSNDNAAGAFLNGNIEISRPLAASFNKAPLWYGTNVISTGGFRTFSGGGRLLANTNAIDGIRLFYSSGVIAEGYYAVNAARFS